MPHKVIVPPQPSSTPERIPEQKKAPKPSFPLMQRTRFSSQTQQQNHTDATTVLLHKAQSPSSPNVFHHRSSARLGIVWKKQPLPNSNKQNPLEQQPCMPSVNNRFEVYKWLLPNGGRISRHLAVKNVERIDLTGTHQKIPAAASSDFIPYL